MNIVMKQTKQYAAPVLKQRASSLRRGGRMGVGNRKKTERALPLFTQSASAPPPLPLRELAPRLLSSLFCFLLGS